MLEFKNGYLRKSIDFKITNENYTITILIIIIIIIILIVIIILYVHIKYSCDVSYF